MDEIPLFRAPKRRKFAKPLLAERPSSAPPLAQEDDDKSTSSTPSSSDEGDTIYSQLRKPVRHSKLGVSFTSNVRSLVSDHDDLAIVPVDNTTDKLKHVTDRFVGTTGLVVDVDRHMMAYIDSEMARRRQPDVPSNTDDTTPPAHASGATTIAHSSSIPLSKEPQQQHQLAEVDLPPSAHKAPPPPKRTRKPRLGRDGRPLRPRRPKHRNSDDLARDALVEQVLHEHRLDHYQTQQPPPPPPDPNNPPSSTTTHGPTDSVSLATATDPSSSTANAATAAAAAATEDDEAFALRFQREFEEGLAEKQAMQRKPQKRNKDADKDGKDSKSHGPRLGGSRSARAKMVAMREAEKEKGKGVGGSGGAGR